MKKEGESKEKKSGGDDARAGGTPSSDEEEEQQQNRQNTLSKPKNSKQQRGAVAGFGSDPQFKDQSELPQFKDQVRDRAMAQFPQRIHPSGLPGAIATPPSNVPRFKDQVGDRRHLSAAGERTDHANDVKPMPAHQTSSPVASHDDGTPKGLVVPSYKDQVREVNEPFGAVPDRPLAAKDGGPTFKDQVIGASAGASPNAPAGVGMYACAREPAGRLPHQQNSPPAGDFNGLPLDEPPQDFDVEQPSPGAQRQHVSSRPGSSSVSSDDEPTLSTLLLQAELVESDGAIRERILNDAVEAEVFDESRASRRRIVAGLVLVCIAAAVVGAIAGTVGRNSVESTTILMQTDAPSSAPTLSPTTVLRNDICIDARTVTFTGGSEVFENSLNASTPDADSIDCLDNSRSKRGWWYTFAGNGLTVNAELCTDSGQIRKPLVMTGRCGELSCSSDVNSTYSINASSSECIILESLIIPTAAETKYWIFVYTDSDLLIGGGSYRLHVSSNDICEGALDINIPARARFTGSTAAANPDDVPSCGEAIQQPAGVWFRWDGNGTFVSLSTCDNNAFDAKISVYEGSCGSLRCVAGEYESCGEQSRVVWFAEKGALYRILLHGGSPSSKGPFTLTATEIPAYTRCERGGVLDLAVREYFGSALDAGYPRGPIADVSCGVTATSRGVWYTLIGTNVGVRCSQFCVCNGSSTIYLTQLSYQHS